ncbi:hypothetical protein [Lacipirellula sp.]|uniref:hypothetical protein n=1 Tax=Lacipirellula sp. TaxID=2691419 RepID=UPI003D146D35
MIASTWGSVLLADETPAGPAADQRDFSAEAAARHADRFEALRDPELRRHYLDQLESRRWSDLESRTPGESQLTPGGGELPPEIRQIQKALGGPQVDQFPSLRSDAFNAPSSPPRNDRSSRVSQREVIRALRDAATQLDATANRLEQLDLYRQADGLRHQAQQLRIDARSFGGDPQTTPTPSAPTPASWEQWPAPSAPALAPQPMLLPDAIPQPTLDAIPTPAPTPEPKTPNDPPKPQPLNDAPTNSPIAEPQLED